MKITILSTMEGFNWGGSEELWHKVALALLSKGHQVQICYKYWEHLPDKIVSLEKAGTWNVFRKPTSTPTGFLKHLKKKKSYQPDYFQDISDFNPDFMLISQGGTFDLFESHQNFLYQFINSLEIPYSLISQFNFDFGNILAKDAKYKLKTCRSWSSFYFVSARNFESAIRQSGHNILNSQFVDNPVNLNSTAIAQWPRTKELQIACVARYDCNFKGQDILIEVLADQDFREIPFRLNFYGSGPDKEHLNDLVAFYKLENKILINQSATDIDAIWDNNHMLILPSLAEGTPLSLQEAMIKGRTALVCDVGDCSKLINENNGFIIPHLHKQLLKAKLIEIFSKPLDFLAQLGLEARATALLRINPNPEYKIVEDILSCKN